METVDVLQVKVNRRGLLDIVASHGVLCYWLRESLFRDLRHGVPPLPRLLHNDS
jgi:hypothetical protein